MASELTKQEQANVRAAMRVLRIRHGGLALLAARMNVSQKGLETALYGGRGIGALTAIRVAQAAGASVEDVLTGQFPGPTACRHCGMPFDEATGANQGEDDVH